MLLSPMKFMLARAFASLRLRCWCAVTVDAAEVFVSFDAKKNRNVSGINPVDVYSNRWYVCCSSFTEVNAFAAQDTLLVRERQQDIVRIMLVFSSRDQIAAVCMSLARCRLKYRGNTPRV